MNCNKTYLVGCIWLLLIRTGTTAQHAGTTAQNEWNTQTVLDSQLQDAIYQFEHKHGVVEKVTNDGSSKSSKLTKALQDRVPIIIVTIQTFPFVLDAIRETTSLKDRTFAVIADEAHSSQTGATAKKLKQVLSAERAQEIEDGGEIDIEELLEAEMAGRLQPKNISFFAFTATPKAKTMELFGRVGVVSENGK